MYENSRIEIWEKVADVFLGLEPNLPNAQFFMAQAIGELEKMDVSMEAIIGSMAYGLSMLYKDVFGQCERTTGPWSRFYWFPGKKDRVLILSDKVHCFICGVVLKPEDVGGRFGKNQPVCDCCCMKLERTEP